MKKKKKRMRSHLYIIVWNAFEYRQLFFYLSVWACTWKSLAFTKAKQSLVVLVDGCDMK